MFFCYCSTSLASCLLLCVTIAMLSRKRCSASSGAPGSKRRNVTTSTIEKWKAENDKMANHDHMKTLACTRFNAQQKGMRNYTSAFIDGTTNLRTSSFKDHASIEMHARAMMLLKKDRGADVYKYTPIVRALSTMKLQERK